MWLESRASLMREHVGPIIFHSPLYYGVNQLIEVLRDGVPAIWVEFTEQDKDDAVAQGNRLADALKARLGSSFILHSLPYGYGLSLLKNQLGFFGPFSFVLTGADYGPNFAQDFLSLADYGRVAIQFDDLPAGFKIPENALLLGKDALRLSLEEASVLAAGRIDEKTVQDLLAATDGAYERMSAELNKLLALPPPLLPGPQGPRFPQGYEPIFEAEDVLKLLIKKERWLEALELATSRFPERTAEILVEAGPIFHERGMHKRLWELLEPLPESTKENEVVLFWLLSAAFYQGHADKLKRPVEAFLAKNEAPELRALYAGVLAPFEERYNEAKRAYEAKKTPLTVYQLGVRSLDISESIGLLKEAVKLSEQSGHPYDTIRNASVLAERLILQGQYQEASSWCSWALAEADRWALSDGQRRLHIVNTWAYARLLCGELAGLENLLTEHEALLALSHPGLASLFRSTLGDFLLADKRPAEALRYYRLNLETSVRGRVGFASLDVVRTLIELGEIDEAFTIAKRALDISQIDVASAQAPAQLAYGMVLSFQDPFAALPFLKNAQQAFTKAFFSYRLMQTSLYLAFVYQQLGDSQSVKQVLRDCGEPLRNLASSGLRLLSGPEEAFRELWALLGQQQHVLEIRLLGESEVWYEHKRLELPPQWLEILAILSLKKQPVGLEELTTYLFGDGGDKKNLKTTLSKMRGTLPISRHPYQLEIPYRVDVTELELYLQKGKIHKALELYKGVLLSYSDSPFLRELDETLSEMLRQAALKSGNVEVLFKLSEYMDDDLELLEALLAQMSKSDPRTSMIGARVRQLELQYQSSVQAPFPHGSN